MGKRRRRIVRRLHRQSLETAKNATLELENSVAQEALKEALQAPKVTLAAEPIIQETTETAKINEIDTTTTKTPVKATKRRTRKTTAKRAPRKTTTRKQTQSNSSK